MHSFVSRSLLALTLVLGTTAQALPAYKEKEAAIAARVRLELGSRIPELVRIRAIEEIHSLIFDQGLGSFFGKDATVRRIVFEDTSYNSNMNAELAASITALRGHTLPYPSHYDASAIIASNLATEAQIQKDLSDLIRGLKEENSRLTIEFETDVITHAPNSNRTRLELLTNFDAVLTARADILSSVKSFRSFTIVDRLEIFGQNGFFRDNDNKSATLIVGRSARYGSELRMGLETLETVLDIGTEKRFNVKPSYFMDRKMFAEGAQALASVLADSSLVAHLRKNGVEGFEIDDRFESRDNLINNGTVSVGLTQEDITKVLNLLFP